MSEKAKEEIDSFKEKVKSDAEELVLKRFPPKILDLDILSNSEKFSPNSGLHLKVKIQIPEQYKWSSESGEQKTKTKSKSKPKTKQKNLVSDEDELIVKPFLFPNGEVESNQLLIEMIDVLKPRMLELTEDILLLKLAVCLMVPKIEDGNNFGVEIQQEAIVVINGFESEVMNTLATFESYFESRGDLIAKVAKYPHCSDYRIAIEESDHKFHLNLCLTLTDVRNHYVSLHDLVTKNLTKIKEPRSRAPKDFLY